MLLLGLFSRNILKILRFGGISNESRIQLKRKLHLNNFIHSSVSTDNCSNATNEFTNESFDQQVNKRRLEARRSVLVQVQSEQSCAQLHEYCAQFGQVSSLYHYKVSSSDSHFILLEFDEVESVKEALKNCGHNDKSQIIPCHSHMLWFRANHMNKNPTYSGRSGVPLQTRADQPSRTQLLEWMKHTENISDQMLLLYRVTKLDELGVRLRYLTAYQLEAAVAGLFPRAQVLMFGSSSNGFGRQGCDLDLVLQLDNNQEEVDAACRLMFQTKPSSNVRSQNQRHIDGLADLVQWFFPGCNDVRRILLAGVPIVKFRQEFTDIECDLSLTNMTAVYMSELLYIYGALDWRLRPLVFAIRRWAAEVGLTNPSPGRWITNFSITLLVIFFLQRSQILPTLDFLRKKASRSDRRVSEDGVNCTFSRDVSRASTVKNSSSLESLLLSFFEYYAAFDFSSQGISLCSGSPVKKRDHSALYITNPLETHLNVSQNVSLEETERLKIELRNAAWELESTECEDGTRPSEWGLLKLYKEDRVLAKARHLNYKYFTSKRMANRLMPVSKLFEEEPEQNIEKS